MAKQKIIMFALALMIATHSSLLSAQSSSPQQAAMSWPMQQGESLNDVARLFYPKNQYMQRQFVAAAIKLNQETQPDLNAATAFTQESSIVIPDIKALSKKSPRQLAPLPRKSKDDNVVAPPEISAKLQANYDDLVKRNALFKQELEELNAKLAHLQQVFAELKIELMRLIDSIPAAAPPPEVPVVVQNPALQTQNNLPATAEKSIERHLQNSNAQAKPNAAAAAIPAHKEQVSYIYLAMPILTSLLVIGLFVGLALYARRQTEKLKSASDHTFAPLEKTAFADSLFVVPPSLKTKPLTEQKAFAGSISEVAPADHKAPDEKEEGELMLEQAKIYVNLDRHDNAIRLLDAHIKTSPKAALQHWFYLLDIYRNTGQKEAFLESAEQLHQTFNVVMPQWENAGDNSSVVVAHSLEDYDYIVNKVTKLWADCAKEASKIEETKSYLDELLMDNRNSERTGFSTEVFEDIMLLREMLDAREKLAKDV